MFCALLDALLLGLLLQLSEPLLQLFLFQLLLARHILSLPFFFLFFLLLDLFFWFFDIDELTAKHALSVNV